MATPARILIVLVAALAVSAAAAALPCPARADDPLTGADILWTRNALKAADLANWQTVDQYAARIENPLAAKLVRWRRLIDSPDGTTFSELDAFLRENPAWPRHRRMIRHAERLMPFEMTPDETLAWFGERQPASAEGAMRIAAALIAKGEKDKGLEMVRQAWIDGNFSKADENDVYKRFKSLLTTNEHIKRMDRLLWDGYTTSAQRMLYKVPEDWRRLAQARSSLRRRTGNVDYLVSKVPANLSGDLGLHYERLRWRRRKNLDSAAELLKGLPEDLPRPELWWQEKSTLARQFVRKGHISEAYSLAAKHGLKPGGEDYAEAEWMAGWIALRFLKDHDVAFKHFENMHRAVDFSLSVSRAAYWAGRTLEAKGDAENAVTWYRKAAEHPFAYYGQLAFARLRPGKGLALPAPVSNEAREKEAEAFRAHELVGVIRILNETGERGVMGRFIDRLYRQSDRPGWQSLTAWLARGAGRPDLAVWIANRAGRDGTALLDVAYPTLEPPALPKTAEAPPPEVPLTLAVIRQESAFRVDAKSYAGARGLMQIITPTAQRVSKDLKLHFSRIKLMTDPVYNMTLGQSYLGGLIRDFKGSYVLALCAYNAGPHRVTRWMREFGDPREADVDAIDWVEMIPFDETRNYVQRVLSNLQVYRSRLAETEVALGLVEDLHIQEE